LAKKATFENELLWVYHQAKGSTHIDCEINNFQSGNNFVITSACENSSIETPTPNMLFSFSSI
jgi:hypothetical protein